MENVDLWFNDEEGSCPFHIAFISQRNQVTNYRLKIAIRDQRMEKIDSFLSWLGDTKCYEIVEIQEYFKAYNSLYIKKVTKISDLIIGEYYFVFWGVKMYWKVKLLQIINEFPAHTELHFESKHGTNLVYCYEIGIGHTKEEAKFNYGKFDFEINLNFSDHYIGAASL